MHQWKVGDEVWARFYDLSIDHYVARLLGHVSGVGTKGFTVKLTKPDHRGKRREQHEHGTILWPTKAEADAFIALEPHPAVKR